MKDNQFGKLKPQTFDKQNILNIINLEYINHIMNFWGGLENIIFSIFFNNRTQLNICLLKSVVFLEKVDYLMYNKSDNTVQ